MAKFPGYQKICEYNTEDLYEYVRKDGKKTSFVAVAARSIGENGGIRVTDDNSVVGLKIKCREMDLGTFGPGYLTGYPFLEGEPEGVYQGVPIGRYTERAGATHLPRFGARIDTGTAEGIVIISGDTVGEVEQGIREYKRENPRPQ